MRDIDFILVNGCSFTEGGGMDNPSFMRELGYEVEGEELQYELRNKLRWSNLLSEHYGCDSNNLAISGQSNDFIRRSTINYVELNKIKLSGYKNKIAIIQASFNHRFNLEHIDHPNQPFAFNPHEIPPFSTEETRKELGKWYELYLKHIFDHKIFNEYFYLETQSLFAYLRQHGFTPYIIFYDSEYNDILNKFNESIIFSGDEHLGGFIYNNKQRFCDVIEWTKDSHFTPKGNELISKELIKHLDKSK